MCVQYEDEDRDKVVLASDDDLAAAVEHARLAGWKARNESRLLLCFVLFFFLRRSGL